jgi:KAP family P-loop domain
MSTVNSRTRSSPSDTETYSRVSPIVLEADRATFMRRVEKWLLSDPRVRGYFVTELVSRGEVLQLLADGQAFDQATMKDSYLLYDKFRKAAAHERSIFRRRQALRGAQEQEERWLDDIIESVIYPNVVEAINTLLGQDWEKLLVEPESEGLKRLQDPIFRVSTRSADRLRRLLSQMDGGSIALAGPRGVGKSTLLKMFSQLDGDRMISLRGICVYVPAPAEYIAKEFIADLFQRLCEAYLQYSRPTAADALPSADGPRVSRSGKFHRMIALSWLAIRALFAVILVMATAGLLIRTAFPKASRSQAALARWIDHVQSLIRIWWSHNLWYFEVVIVLVVLVLFVECWPRPRLWRRYMRGPEERALTKRAHEYLLRLQVDKTITRSTSIASPSLRGMAFGLNRGTSVKYIPWTMPELVGQARRFIEDVSAELKILNRAIFIGIDEIDRIGSLEHAERFIGEIKAIFGIEGCFFIVAVADDVGSIFAQRATAGRSIVENAFDEIVPVRPLDLAEARNLLLRRVPGFTDPFVYLVHALSGGLPRELIRVSRRLLEIHLERAAYTSAQASLNAATGDTGHTTTLNRPYAAYSRLEDLTLALVQEAVVEALDAARKEISQLLLRAAWASVHDAIRLASVTLKQNDSRRAAYLTIEHISQIHTDGHDSGTPENEDAARRVLDRLSAFAYFGITVIDVFSDRYFDLDEVRRRTASELNGSHEDLAAVRVELGVSAASSRMMLDRFRQSLGRDVNEPT